MKIPGNKLSWGLLLLIIVFTIVITDKNVMKFDMSLGKSWEEKYVLGVKIASSEVNPSISRYASTFGLTQKGNPVIAFEIDKNLLFVRKHSHSEIKRIYYDLLSAGKILERKNISEDLYLDEKSRFLKLWKELYSDGLDRK
jgi:hypothetical protein